MAVDLTSPPDDGTPLERLERSRRAIASQLARRQRRRTPADDASFFEDPALASQGLLPKLGRAAVVAWRNHPVHSAVDFARPALEDYAHQNPYRLVGIAAGTGAALALLKRWHVLSLTGVVLAMVKTSDLRAAARTFIAAPPTTPHEP